MLIGEAGEVVERLARPFIAKAADKTKQEVTITKTINKVLLTS